MVIKACPSCGSTTLTHVHHMRIRSTVSRLGQYYCGTCAHVGYPLIFNNKDDYNNFLKARGRNWMIK